MTLRENIYYWKCDNPISIEEKLVYNDKYQQADISEMVRQIAHEHFGNKTVSVNTTAGAGNHYTYIIKLDDKDVFFRADDGKSEDDYMDAEKAAMHLARQQGVPVPEVYATDTSKARYPIRYQLMENIAGTTLNRLDQEQNLDRKAVGIQLGSYLAKLHQIKLDGFGFFDTNLLKKENRIVGLYSSSKDYFFTKLDDHLKYLRDSSFLEVEKIREIERLIDKNAYLLNIDRGSMVHKDIAFWNIIGTRDSINAIIDWDDVIIGEPTDDLSIMRCFYDDDVFIPVLEGYLQIAELPENFDQKIWLYMLRNMLWKAVIRSFMKYFEMDSNFFLRSRENSVSLKEFTYDRLFMAIDNLKKI